MSKVISKNDRNLTYNKFNGRCGYCSDEIEIKKMHVDHINPIYRSWTDEELSACGRTRGTNDIGNLMPSCATCNISKGTFDIEDWREQIQLKIGRLRKNVTNFRIVEKYNLIKVVKTKVKFYFETIKEKY